MITNNVAKFSNNIFKKAVTQLGKPGALLPVVLLEVGVDVGRSYQAYKRGGKTEMRERATDDVSAGAFWLFGAVWLNKIGDWIGKKFLGIKNPEFSLGKDKARDGLAQALSSNPNISARKLSMFKLGKVISSIAIAVGFIGWGLPKINQAITRKLSSKNDTALPKTTDTSLKNDVKTPKENEIIINNAHSLFEDFDKYKKTGGKSNPSFGIKLSTETIGRVAHNLEHNATWRLGTTDGGILVGRTTNARTFDEGLEYGIRDAISSYFYLWAPAHVIATCNKFDRFKGLNTKIDPSTATHVNNYIASIVKESKLTPEEFTKQMFGEFDEAKFNLVKPVLDKNKGRITVEEFCKVTGADKKLARKAELMSRLQPKIKGVSILTDKQAFDVLHTGKISEPRFMYKVMNNYFASVGKKMFGKMGGKVTVKSIKDKLAFISASDMDDMRKNVGDYVQSIVEIAKAEAKKSGKAAEISIDTIKKAAKRNTIFHSSYLAAGLGVSILFLSTLIPKFQYWVTKKRTGQDGFPGVNNEKKAA